MPVVDPSAILLTGKVVIVTGATRGIGRATAELCAQFGAHVAVCDRDADGLDTLSAEIARVIDVRDADTRDAFVAEVVSQLGRVDVLVNNAGGLPAPLVDRGDRPVDGVGLAAGDHDGRASVGEAFGEGEADAPRATGDDGDTTVEAEHVGDAIEVHGAPSSPVSGSGRRAGST